ncbi:MAG: hypothetical protein ACOX17_01945 [Christensenellales bacterium]
MLEIMDNAFAGEESAAERGAESRTTKSSIEQERANSYEGKSLTDDPSVYSYNFLIAQKPMKIVDLPSVAEIKDKGRVERRIAKEKAYINLEEAGKKDGDRYLLINTYTGRTMSIYKGAINHGLGGKIGRVIMNSQIVAKAGDVIKNGIPINALTTESKNATGTYALASICRYDNDRYYVVITTVEQRDDKIISMEPYDVVHAINGRYIKEENRGAAIFNTRVFTPSTPASDVSIADLLKVVNITHQEILSKDVQSYLGKKNEEEGYYTNRTIFSLDADAAENQIKEADPATRYALDSEPVNTGKVLETRDREDVNEAMNGALEGRIGWQGSFPGRKA